MICALNPLFSPGFSTMPTPEYLDADVRRRWFLDTPESQVMAAASERELLLELVDCRQALLRATRRPDGSAWDLARPDAEFRRAVRELAEAGAALDVHSDTGPSAHSSDPSLVRLARRYEAIRDSLALANARLVAYIAKRYLNRGISPADLLQEGFCGLLEAIDRFDPVNTTRLATYAAWWIRQAIQRAIANGSYPVRLTPRQLRKLARLNAQASVPGAADIQQPADTFAPDRDGEAGTDETSDTGTERPVSGRATAEGVTWFELAAIRPRVSLDSVSRFDGTTPMADLLICDSDSDSDDETRGESLSSLLAFLSPREQLILKLRFGLDGQARHSLSQIGHVLTVSKERVRQIEDRALRKLRLAAGDFNHRDPAGPVPLVVPGLVEDSALATAMA